MPTPTVPPPTNPSLAARVDALEAHVARLADRVADLVEHLTGDRPNLTEPAVHAPGRALDPLRELLDELGQVDPDAAHLLEQLVRLMLVDADAGERFRTTHPEIPDPGPERDTYRAELAEALLVANQ